VKGTKTGESRSVDLTRRLTAALGRWRAACAAAALAGGSELSPWIFPTRTGRLLDVRKVGRRFRQIIRRAGLPSFRLYDLRHTFASHLLIDGASIVYVSAMFGHAKPTTTLAYYAHYLPTGDRGLIDRLESIRGAESLTRITHEPVSGLQLARTAVDLGG
jgi:integrase